MGSNMDSNQDNIMEARLGRAVRKAFKQLLKDIESEPTLVIESGDSQSDVVKYISLRSTYFRVYHR